MSSKYFENKKELIEHFQNSISNTYKQLLQENKLEFESNLLKTYLIENNIPTEYDVEWLFSNHLKLKVKGRDIFPKVIRTNDDELLLIRFDNHLDVYVDLSDERIWNFYSLGDAKLTDDVFMRIYNSPFLDRIWMNHFFLDGLQEFGVARGFGLDFDYRKFDKDDDTSSVLKMQLSGIKTASNVYKKLKSFEELQDNICLSKIKIKTYDKELSDNFIIQDIKYNGKITAKGSDISLHLESVLKIKKKYLSILEVIENKYRVGWRYSNGILTLEGYPLYLVRNDGKEINVNLLAEKLFDGSYPYKLLGQIKDIPYGKFVEVLDLHIGATFSLQIFPDMIVAYLREDVCGNSILRLYTNLQHTYSNSFVIENDNGERIV